MDDLDCKYLILVIFVFLQGGHKKLAISISIHLNGSCLAAAENLPVCAS